MAGTMKTYHIYYTVSVGGKLDDRVLKAVSIENLRKRLLEEYGLLSYVHIYITEETSRGEKAVGELQKFVDPMLWKPEGRKTWYMLDPISGRTKGPWSETESMRYKMTMKKHGRL